MVFNETVIAAVAAVIGTLFSREMWSFWKNRDTIKGQINLSKKIVNLEKDLIRAKTAVNMLLTYLESKYGNDAQDKDIIEKVRVYISSKKQDPTE
tara:strand:+ start:288 stop:572 length:285 start_codon:yes stop_codon:yes gene_type:complete